VELQRLAYLNLNNAAAFGVGEAFFCHEISWKTVAADGVMVASAFEGTWPECPLDVAIL
jgi:hypothetical protein